MKAEDKRIVELLVETGTAPAPAVGDMYEALWRASIEELAETRTKLAIESMSRCSADRAHDAAHIRMTRLERSRDNRTLAFGLILVALVILLAVRQ